MTAARETEADFQAAVIALAELHGWRLAHFRPARTERGWRTPMTGDPGWPDLVLARPGRLLLVELKSARGRVTDDQQVWLEVLDSVDCTEVYVWRPGDWAEIVRTLGGRP